MTPEVYIDFINKFDVDKVALTNDEILNAIEDSLKMQGRGETEIEPRTHIRPRAGVEGHFNVLRGWIGGEIALRRREEAGNALRRHRKSKES